MQQAHEEAIGLDRIGQLKPGLSSHFSESEFVRDWQVMMSSAPSSQSPTEKQVADAFDRVVYGFRHGLISIDYVPADTVAMDIPHVEHPHHMQAMVYWCVRLDCTLTVLAEAYARLGTRPSVKNAQSAVERVAKEETLVEKRGFASPATVPVFEHTRPVER